MRHSISTHPVTPSPARLAFPGRPARATARLGLAGFLVCIAAGAQPSPQIPESRSETELYAVRFEGPGLLGELRRDPPVEWKQQDGSAALRRWWRAAGNQARRDLRLRRVEAAIRVRQAEIEARLGRSVPRIGQFLASRPGLVVALRPGEARQLETLPGVRQVRRDRWLIGTTENGPAWIGADAVWSGAATGTMTQGEGVVVAVLDSGIHFGHPSFSDLPADGHPYVNPLGSGTYLGWCDPGNPNYSATYACNDKLIGAWDYMDAICVGNPLCSEADGPADQSGHGTHVASIASGNRVPIAGTIVEMAGVAPHSNLVVYDVCTRQETLPFDAICSAIGLALAIDQAIVDGVDVINVSILGGMVPWSDDDRDLLDAVDAGIFVAASAGNDGPGSSTVAHRGPWLATIGASTHDRDSYRGSLTLSGGPSSLGPFVGGSLNDATLGPAPVVYAGDYGSMDAVARVCGSSRPTVGPNPFPPGTFSGEIVACESFEGMQSSPTTFKSKNLLDAGAGGMIQLGQASDSVAFATVIPSLGLEAADSTALRNWLASGTGHQAEISIAARTDSSVHADRVRDFSSVGPNPLFDVVKPDFVAPGSAIRLLPSYQATGVLGAESVNSFQPEFGGTPLRFASGTSMSSPNVAGAAALLLALHPGWSPDQVRSALATTAVRNGITQQDGTTPATDFDRGSGRIDVAVAARATLLLAESTAAYLAADPANSGDPATLNVASLMSSDCSGTCSWQRTFTNEGTSTTSWDVALVEGPVGLELVSVPPSLTLTAGASGPVDFTVHVTSAALLSSWQHATIELTPDDVNLPSTALPLLLQPSAVSSVVIFNDGFESGNVSEWTNSLP
jgi:hypothetical protein